MPDGSSACSLIGPLPVDPVSPLTEQQPRRELLRTLKQIDGWGEHGWRLIHGTWQLRGLLIVIEPREHDPDPLITLVLPQPLSRCTAADDTLAMCDWALERLRTDIIDTDIIRTSTLDRSDTVRASSAAFIHQQQLFVRLIARLPFAGLCCDGLRFGKFIRCCEAFVANLRPNTALRKLRQSLQRQTALRSAISQLDIIAFIEDGSRLARNRDGSVAAQCTPVYTPKKLATTLDLGPLGRAYGLAIQRGITAFIGAPYHGKSTILQAIAAGCDAHRPGDGREGVVCQPDAWPVQAEEGRPIHHQDMRAFFTTLPTGDVGNFTTNRASGATSMAATVCQGIAAGHRILVIDEDTAAGNFLWIDSNMRQLLRRDADSVTLAEALPALAQAGISTIIAVGSATPVLAAAHTIIRLSHFQPSDCSAQVRTVLGPPAATHPQLRLPPRTLIGHDLLLADRHRLVIDVREPERPRIQRDAEWWTLDLRRSGWNLDGDLTRSAILAAAWCLRLGTTGMPLTDCGHHFHQFIAQRGPRGLDPFDTTMTVVPPWPLVVCVMERLPVATCKCTNS